MTGRYIIQLDGTIYVPFVGVVKAADLTRSALQHTLEVKSSSLFDRPVMTVVRLIERQPIYVTGAVPHPGVFDYRSGMTVLHAMILAGLRTAGPQNAERIGVLQETERLQKSDATLANLIARRDVLVALRDGRDPAPSAVLTHLVGRTAAKQWIIAASRLAELEAGK
jgi:protein involved in polysaccharide export with SLBB domain